MLLLPQDFDRLGRDGDCPVGVFGFQRSFHGFTIHSCNLAAHLDDAIFPVNLTLLETEELTSTQAGCQLDVVHFVDSGGFRFLKECLELLCRDGNISLRSGLGSATALQGFSEMSFCATAKFMAEEMT